MNNKVVKGQLSKEMEAVKTEYVVVADNDAIPMTDNWVEELLKYCQWKHVGITGVKCLNKNKKIESCGLIMTVMQLYQVCFIICLQFLEDIVIEQTDLRMLWVCL